MKAVVLRSPENLAVLDVPEPLLSAGQAMIRVSQCGICGSDVRYYHGENPWAKHTLGRHVDNPPNIILGHEFVGTVEEVHDDTYADLVGKRVGVNTWTTCGRCEYCVSGRENFCSETKHLGHGQGWGKMDYYPGGMSTLCPAFSDRLYALPHNISDDQAVFFDPLTAALHAVDVGNPKFLDRVAVLGAGPIGLMIAQLAKARGIAQTFITDVAAENLAVAKEVGVDHTMNVRENPKGLCELVMDETGGSGVDVVWNTVGTPESIEESLSILGKGGTLVLLVTKDKEIRFPALLLGAERTIKTSTNAMYSDFPRAIDLLSKGIIKVEPLITGRYRLPEALSAFEAACNKEKSGAIKIVIECQS